MAKAKTKKLTKTTNSGITVTLINNIVIKRYSETFVSMVTFLTPEDAKKEFGLFRQSHKR